MDSNGNHDVDAGLAQSVSTQQLSMDTCEEKFSSKNLEPKANSSHVSCLKVSYVTLKKTPSWGITMRHHADAYNTR